MVYDTTGTQACQKKKEKQKFDILNTIIYIIHQSVKKNQLLVYLKQKKRNK